MKRQKEFSIFSPFFRVPRVRRRASHIRLAFRAEEPGAAAFSAMGELNSSLPLCRRRQRGNEAQECTRAVYPARGNTLDMVHSLAFEFFDGAPQRRLEGATKGPKSRGFPRPGLFQAQF